MIWTGSEAIVWGGYGASNVLNTGAKYNPNTNTWSATTTTGAPAARKFQSAVWTGQEMIVWGGEDAAGNPLNNGAKYNPTTNSWATMTTVGSPAARKDHSAAWTTTEMIIWGGLSGATYYNTGARYNPSTDSWTAMTTINAPTARSLHAAIWTGGTMIVWGGFSGATGYTNTGGLYNPAADSWSATSTTNAPTPRGYFNDAAAFNGTEFIFWGGYVPSTYLNTGGLLTFDATITVTTSLALSDTTPAAGQTVTATAVIKNKTNAAITLTKVGIANYFNYPSSNIRDFGLSDNITINANSTRGLNFSRKITDVGNHRAWVVYEYSGVWYAAPPDTTQITAIDYVSHMPNVKVTSHLMISPYPPAIGNNVTATSQVTNSEGVSITLDKVGIANYYDYPAPNIRDFGLSDNQTLGIGAVLPLSYSRVLTDAGNYRAWVVMQIGNTWYSMASDTGKLTQIDYPTHIPNIKATQHLLLNSYPVPIGSYVNATATLQNNEGATVILNKLGIANYFNYPSANVQDFGMADDFSFGAGATQALSYTRNITDLGNYHAWLTMQIGSNWYQISSDTGKLTAIDYPTRLPNIKVTDHLMIDPWPPKAGAQVTATTAVTNNESEEIFFDAIGIANYLDYPAPNIRDFGMYEGVALFPGMTGPILVSRTLTEIGNYKAWIVMKIGNNWINVSSDSGKLTEINYPVGMPNIKVTGHLFLSPYPVLADNFTLAHFMVTNHETYPITLDSLGVANYLNFPSSNVRDYEMANDITLSPGETLTPPSGRILGQPGNYTAWAAMKLGNNWYKLNSDTGKVTEMTYYVAPGGSPFPE